MKYRLAILCSFLFITPVLAQQPKEADKRLHADGKGWRLDKANVTDAHRPRVLLIGDSILNGYLKQVTAALEGKVYVDAWVNPYNQSEHVNKLLAEVLAHGPYDVVHFNMGLHGWQKGRIKEGAFEPLTRAYVEVIRTRLPRARIVWASSTPVTVKNKPTELEAEINPVIVEHNRLAAKVMKELNVPVNDFYSLLEKKLELARGDQFHWKPEAYRLLADAVVARVLQELQQGDAKLHILKERASVIDPRAREHPAIDFLFADKKDNVLDWQHAVVDTRVPAKGKLVVWLMGYNPPLFERVAGYGYHGIQVHYANKWFSKIPKEAMTDGVSLGKVRLEAATGENHSPLVAIPRPDGMMERAYQFVNWLAKKHPQGEWGQFLTEDGKGLRWDLVTVSGISHGSTTAARFALHQKVDRVVMFSGPRDQTESWQGFASATPSERFFGFTHVLDGGWTGDHYCRSWQMLGLHKHGPIVDVEKTPVPFGNSRRLISTFDVNNDTRRAHTCVVPGGSACKDSKGQFVHEAVWRYLFNHPVHATGEAVPIDPKCRLDEAGLRIKQMARASIRDAQNLTVTFRQKLGATPGRFRAAQ